MNVSLRELRDTDLPLLLAWSHIKEIWTYLPTAREGEHLTWEAHFNWWKSRTQRADWVILANTDNYGPRPVGVVHGELTSGEIGIYIGETTLWGAGIGKKAIEIVLQKMKARGFDSVWAVVHPENERSQRLFAKASFEKRGKGRNDQDLYVYSFS